MTDKKGYSNIKVTKLDKSRVEIEGEISAEKMSASRSKAIKKIGADVTLPGFRKGMAPEDHLIKHVGEMAILEEAAETALSEEYGNILIEYKIDAIGRPNITITKIAPANPLGFKIETAVMPTIKLGDYKKIAKAEMAKANESTEATDKEVDAAVENIRAHYGEQEPHEHKEGEKCEHKPKLPELNDAFAQRVGDFKTLEELKAKIKENIVLEKTQRNKEKKRITTVEKIIKESEFDIPELLVESELDKILAQMQGDIERMGLKFEDYLKHLKKTVEDIRKDMRPDAETRAKSQLILNKIAVEEKIEANKEAVEKEVKVITEQYKEADPERARIYVETMFTNEEVFKFLENQAK
jgi:FKBP-type peptidyl-prolyl cis-trans isomerase (trigger factor)